MGSGCDEPCPMPHKDTAEELRHTRRGTVTQQHLATPFWSLQPRVGLVLSFSCKPFLE